MIRECIMSMKKKHSFTMLTQETITILVVSLEERKTKVIHNNNYITEKMNKTIWYKCINWCVNTYNKRKLLLQPNKHVNPNVFSAVYSFSFSFTVELMRAQCPSPKSIDLIWFDFFISGVFIVVVDINGCDVLDLFFFS